MSYSIQKRKQRKQNLQASRVAVSRSMAPRAIRRRLAFAKMADKKINFDANFIFTRKFSFKSAAINSPYSRTDQKLSTLIGDLDNISAP